MKVETAEHVEAAHRPDQFLRDDRPEVAFVGRSNVGKSSLMNRLLGRQGLARTSSTPGRTQAVHYYLVNRRLYFVDLPGYGYAKASKEARREWAELVESYFHHDRQERLGPLVVMLVDAKVGATPLDVQALEYLASFGVPVVVVATKVDRVPRSRRSAAMAEIGRTLHGSGPVPVSAQSGEGIKQLWQEIARYLHGEDREKREEDG